VEKVSVSAQPASRSTDPASAELRLPHFSFYISPINQACLRFGDSTLNLNNLIESGDVVTVAVRGYPYLLMRLGYN